MQVSNRTSSAVRSIDTDILRGLSNVEFVNGSSTPTSMFLVVLLQTCCFNPTCLWASGLMQTASGCCLITLRLSLTQTINLIYSISMSNPFYQVLGKASKCVFSLALNPGNGSAMVEFNHGGKYLIGISAVALGGLYDLDSLGQFVNQSAKQMALKLFSSTD